MPTKGQPNSDRLREHQRTRTIFHTQLVAT